MFFFWSPFGSPHHALAGQLFNALLLHVLQFWETIFLENETLFLVCKNQKKIKQYILQCGQYLITCSNIFRQKDY
jgi:hypothetical protein